MPRFTSVAARLRDARYAIEDAAFTAGRIPVAIGRGLHELWLDLSMHARQRIALVLGVLVALALVWVVAVPAPPRQAPGGGTGAPAHDAIHPGPQNPPAHVHVDVHP